ncbi:wall-associated receptor kinase 2-like [Carex rostrata]
MQRAMISIQLFLLLLLQFKNIESANTMIALPGCPESCEGSDILIPYPFGIGIDCSLSQEFNIRCNQRGPSHGLSLIKNINLPLGQARSSRLVTSTCSVTTLIFYSEEPFRLNTEKNKFTVIGCNTLGYLNPRRKSNSSVGCLSSCDSQDIHNELGSCSGIGCCQTDIPKGTITFSPTFDMRFENSEGRNYSPCSYAMVVEEAEFQMHPYYITTDALLLAQMPIVFDWAIGNTTCEDAQTNKSSYACRSDHSVCLNSNSSSGGYLCNCSIGYEGNPYLDGGCQDIDECANQNPCSKPGKCHNLHGNYSCSCPFGWRNNDDKQGCHLNVVLVIGMTILLGFVIACSIILLYIAIAKRINLFEEKKQEKLKKKFFDQNQGSLLQQLMASNVDATQNTRILTLKELEKATNGFDNALILGRGGYGYVYKGILSDQRVVAVKRSKIDDPANDQRSVAQQATDRQAEINQFINEVVILSQVNHRNIVKLYGCCLETEVPLLVYEFISNGTLFNHLHVEDHCSLTWKHRLRIALETAGAISYLHSSAASISVLHRDIKSANILLDDYFTAKVSDFGISKPVQIDQTGIDTIIQGTLGYLDPEYHTTARLTQKSDVFSFGVILAELLTRKKPLFSSRMFEGGNLIGYFCDAMKENRLFEIIDPQVMNEENKTELEAVAKLAELCLRLKGEERPTMKKVEVQLEVLWRSDQPQKHPLTSQSFEVRRRRAHYTTLEIEQPQPSSIFFTAKDGF